jgi:BA14K-like protein
MIKSICALAVTVTLGLAVLAASGTNSSASPVVLSAGQAIGNPNMIEVARRGSSYGYGRSYGRYGGRRCLYGGCYSNRGYYGHRGYYGRDRHYAYRRHYGHHHNYGGFYLGYPLFFGGGFGDYYGDGYYGNGNYYGNYNYSGSAHVEWCLNRYRSYRPRTNTWTSYSGRVRRCISPYS